MNENDVAAVLTKAQLDALLAYVAGAASPEEKEIVRQWYFETTWFPVRA